MCLDVADDERPACWECMRPDPCIRTTELHRESNDLMVPRQQERNAATGAQPQSRPTKTMGGIPPGSGTTEL